jgi:hypothetical protein
MTIAAEVVLPIDLRLRFVFFGLECAFDVTLNGVECERVFRESDEDQVSAKRYCFHESPKLHLDGQVDEYEPDTIRLKVRGSRGCDKVLRRVATASEFHSFRLRQSTSARELE